MRKVIMALAIRKTSNACERCQQPVHPGSDFLRAQLRGRFSWWHWWCFITAMRESNQRSAQIIESTVTT
jgi:hypothetical protein